MRIVVLLLALVVSCSISQGQQKYFKKDLDIPKDKLETCHKMFEKAKESMNNNRNLQALKELDEIIAYEPKYPWAYSNKALVLYGLDSLDECLRYCDKSEEMYGYNYLSWKLRGDVNQRKGEFEKAVMCFDESFRVEPKSDVLISKAECLFELNRRNDALQIMREYLRLMGKSADAYYNMAYMHLKCDNLDSALFYAKEAISAYSWHKHANSIIGAVYSKRGDIKQAIKYYKKSIDKKIETFRSSIYLAELYLVSGEADECEDVLDDVKHMKMQDFNRLQYLFMRLNCRVYLKKNTDEELKEFEKLLSIKKTIEWDFSRTDAWLARTELSPESRAFLEKITKQFKEYVRINSKK